MISSKVFVVLRGSPEGDQHILAVTNVTEEVVEIHISLKDLGMKKTLWKDLLNGLSWKAEGDILCLTIGPYGVLWLKP
jgi:sucrose phosphorylase